jgi:GNAT superfamily N-acetyltransferase
MASYDDVIVRPAEPDDCDDLFCLIEALAEFEQLSNIVTGNASSLKEHLFGANRYAEAIVAEVNGTAVGFALFFHNYSTFLTKPGIYLEDIFVMPEHRQQGIGKALLKKVAQIAADRDCGRLEWSVLDWNEPAKTFYRRMGAKLLDEWKICRLSGGAINQLNGGK